MSGTAIDPMMLHAWLAARSIARGLPAPVADRGGYRVDTHSEGEVKRWVFPGLCPGISDLARTIDEPRHFLKACGDAEGFRKLLTRHWRLHDPAYFMIAVGSEQGERPIAPGYAIKIERNGTVIEVRVSADDGAQVASGYAAETEHAFVYDRIMTAPDHRRKGVGNAVMAALRGAKRNPEAPELLVATADGRALYLTMGWRTLSIYLTASIPEV